uniref:Uncharacterized protein n=1 Tax=Sphaerodactylus townsendi TaxID=933632 RepID=A0ACB8EDP8_9SAUR
MEEAQRQLLQRSRVRLVEKLQVEPLWDLLVHREIFTQDMIEEIQRAGTRRDQARQLITDLQTRGKAALPTFIWCLRKTGQEDLAILLSEGCNRPQLQPVHIESNVVHSHAGQIDPGPVEKRTSRNDDMVYVLNSDPCGYCLIINNVTFSKESGLSTRTGSDVDCKRLEERFGSLHFQVLTRRNLTRQTRHNQFPGGILGTDGKPIAVEKIVSCFDGSHCPPLRGKPKLFFIQACGGEQKDRGFEVEVDPSVNQQHGSTLDSDATPFQIAAGDSDQPDAIAILPTPSDILVSYSTFPGFVSWRDKSSGSWYVETLDDILGKFARSEDLLVMLTRVQNSISAKDKYKQMPGNFNFLRKKFFFKAR